MKNEVHSLRAKILLYISFLLRASIAVAIVISIIEAQWLTLFLASIALISTFLPALMEKSFKVSIPPEFEFIVTIFLYTSLFLGSTQDFYNRYDWWDTALHSVSGVILGFIGFVILFTLHEEGKLDMSPSLLAIFSFAFALALGAVWEIFEYFIDVVFAYGMQPSDLDTMKDLILDSAGALLTAILGYFYVKKHGESTGLFDRMVRSFIDMNIDNSEKY